MKVGDVVPVSIAGQVVANATVKELGEGQAVLIVPATRVVMAVRTELSFAPEPVQEQEKETIITGVERAGEVAPVAQNVETENVGGTVAQEVETQAAAPGTDVTSNTDGTVIVDGAPAETTAQGNDPAADAAVNNELPAQQEVTE